jgi:hypothetical protein
MNWKRTSEHPEDCDACSLKVNYYVEGGKLMVRYWMLKEQHWSPATVVEMVEAAQRLQLLENQFFDSVANSAIDGKRKSGGE